MNHAEPNLIHRLFTARPQRFEAAAHRTIPLLLYRLPPGADEDVIRAAAMLRGFGCEVISPSDAVAAETMAGDHSAADASAVTVPFITYSAEDFPGELDVRTVAVEWRLFAGQGTPGHATTLADLAMRLPIDVNTPLRLQQRVAIWKSSLPDTTLFGLAVSVDSADANTDVYADLPIDFLTIVSPAAVLPEDHPALDVVDRPPAEVIRRFRDRCGDRRIRIICQARLGCGYDVAYYLAAGADAVVINGCSLISAGMRKRDSGQRLFDMTTAFSGGKDSAQAAAIALERFLAEVLDGTRYFNLRQ